MVGAARGQGATRIHQEEVAEIIGPSGFRDVEISEEHLLLALQAGGDPIDIDESAARIRRNDIAGDILLDVPKNGHLLIRLPEPVDGVKFQDLRFVDRAIALGFSLIDPELFCASPALRSLLAWRNRGARPQGTGRSDPPAAPESRS